MMGFSQPLMQYDHPVAAVSPGFHLRYRDLRLIVQLGDAAIKRLQHRLRKRCGAYPIASLDNGPVGGRIPRLAAVGKYLHSTFYLDECCRLVDRLAQ